MSNEITLLLKSWVKHPLPALAISAAAWLLPAAPCSAQSPGTSQVQKLDNPDAAESEFGFSVMKRGDRIVVGSPRRNSWEGAAHVWRRSESTGLWQFEQRLSANDAIYSPRRLGDSVAISGQRIAVGASTEQSLVPSTGAVYIFERSAGSWKQRVKLLPDGGFAFNARMGFSVALEGDILAAGSPESVVRIFEKSGALWNQTATVQAPDGVLGDAFGSAISLSGNLLAVGAQGSDPFRDPLDFSQGNHTGSVYLFQRQNASTWNFVAKLVASDAAAQSFFGKSLELRGERCAVGASEKAYIFEREGATWVEKALLDKPGVPGFGARVALDGDALLVTDPDDDLQGEFAGAVHAYHFDSGSWVPQGILRAADGAEGTGLGISVSSDGGQLAAGAFGAEAVYVFNIPTTQPNSAPTGLTLSNQLIAEQQPSGTLVGNFQPVDPDAGETFTYALVQGSGDADNALFRIEQGALLTDAVLNFDQKAQHSVRVRVQDAAGESFEAAFTLTVIDLSGPVTIALQNLAQTYDGTPRAVNVATTPAGLQHELLYDDEPDAPVLPGSYPVTATITQPGYFPQTASGTLVVAKKSQTITFPAIADRSLGDPSPFAHGATASSGLQVYFTTSDSDVAEADETFVAVHGAGTVTLTASQPGDDFHDPAPPVQRTFTVSKLPQTITFPPIADRSIGDPNSFAHGASASSGLPLQFTSSDPAVAEVNGAHVQVFGGGTVTLTASQPGDGTYAPALPVPRTFTVSKLPQTLDQLDWQEIFVVGGALPSPPASDQGLPLTLQLADPSLANPGAGVWAASGQTTATLSNAGNFQYDPVFVTVPVRVFSHSVLTQRFASGRHLLNHMGREYLALAAVEGVAAVTIKGVFDKPMVHIFEKDAQGLWVEAQELRKQRHIYSSSTNDGFGSVLALSPSGAVLAVREPGHALEQGGFAQAVLVYERGADGAWKETAVLTAPPATDVRFGSQIAFAGQTLCVSVPGLGGAPGEVRFYEKNAGDWAQSGSLTASVAGSEFGLLMDAHGDLLAARNVVGGAPSVEVFRRGTGGAWDLQSVIPAPGLGIFQDRLLLRSGRLLMQKAGGGAIWEPDTGAGGWVETATFGTLPYHATLLGGVMVFGDAGNSFFINRRRGNGSWFLTGGVNQAAVFANAPPPVLLSNEVVTVANFSYPSGWPASLPSVCLASFSIGQDSATAAPTALVPGTFSLPEDQPAGTLIGQVISTGGTPALPPPSIFAVSAPHLMPRPGWLVSPAPPIGGFSVDLSAMNAAGLFFDQTVGVNATPPLQALGHLSAPSPTASEGFGMVLAATDRWLVTGTVLDRVHIHTAQSGGWTHHATLSVPSPAGTGSSPGFGSAVAVWADRIAIGAPQDGGQPGQNHGSVRIYEPDDGGDWAQAALLESPFTMSGARFGEHVAMSGNLLAVAAPGAERVCLFRRSAKGVWTLEHTLEPSGVVLTVDAFGTSLSLHGERVAVGCSGSVFVFERDDDAQWRRHAFLRDQEVPGQSNYGTAVALSGEILAVGNPHLDGGTVIVYERSPDGSWLASTRISQPLGLATHDYLSVRGDRLLVGNHLYRRLARDLWLREKMLPVTNPVPANAMTMQSLVLGHPAFSSPASNAGRVSLHDGPPGSAAPAAPTLILLEQNFNLGDDVPPGTVVGRLSAVDPDPDDTFAFELMPCAASNSNAHFFIDGDLLRTATRLDVKGGAALMNIALKVTDSQGHTLEQLTGEIVHDVMDWPADTHLVGVEGFDYPDGPLDGQDGGFGFDFDNTTLNGPYIGHTGTASPWVKHSANPSTVSNGRLVTSESSVTRAFNGPGTGSDICSDELSGAFSAAAHRQFKQVYIGVKMTRSPATGFSGISGLTFGGAPFFAGVASSPNPASGQREFTLLHENEQQQWVAKFSDVQPVDNQTYHMVVRLDFAAGTIALWLDPQLSAGEAGNAPLISVGNGAAAYGLTRLQIHSGFGTTTWDDLVVATNWAALGVPNSAPIYADSLADYLTAQGLAAGAGGEDDDLNGDGIPLLLGWALGLNAMEGLAPGQEKPWPAPQPPASPADAPRFFFILPNQMPPIDYHVEASTQLGAANWTELARRLIGGPWQVTGPATLTSAPYGPHHHRYEVRLTPPLSAIQSLFVRLRVSSGAAPMPLGLEVAPKE